MKKYILIIVLAFFPIFVYAEDLEYHICKEDCEYQELETVMSELNALRGTSYDVTIYIDDNATYELTDNNYLYNKRGWVNGNYMSRINTLTIIGTAERPTITSNNLHQDFNYVDRSLFIETWSDITIKNINFDMPSSILFGSKGIVTIENVDMNCTAYYTYSTATDNKINNVNINGYFSINKGSITNAKINGLLYIEKEVTGNNLTINGYMEVRGTLNINNTVIDATNHEYGLKVIYEDCFGDCSAYQYNHESYIKNTTIKNAQEEAILYQRGTGNHQNPLYIDNADLSNNPTSIVMYNNYPSLNDNYDGYSVITTNSKISGAETGIALDDWYYRDDLNMELPVIPADTRALNMYFDYTNTWTKEINRVDSVDKKESAMANVVETNNGKIIIEKQAAANIVLNVDKEINFTKYFEEKGLVLSEVEILDNSIVKFEDGKLIPLKIGETDIKFQTNGSTYVLHVSITEAKVNPITSDKIVLLVIIFVTSIAIITLLIRKKKMLE